MALRIIDADDTALPVAREIEARIASALPGARARARCLAPGHFEIEVECAAFAGQPRVRQHQRVYAAIEPLMSGDAPPVHAIDRLDTRIP